MVEKIGELSDNVLKALLRCNNILSGLYDLWCKKDDNNYRGMKKYVEEIEGFAKEFEGRWYIWETASMQ